MKDKNLNKDRSENPWKYQCSKGGGDIGNISKFQTRTNTADFAAFNWYFWEKQDNCTEENNTLVSVYWKYGKKKVYLSWKALRGGGGKKATNSLFNVCKIPHS